METHHESVLLREVVEALNVQPNKWYLDLTLGDGGHSLEILKRGGKVVGVDVDPEALERTRKRLEDAGYSNEDFLILSGNFKDIESLIQQIPMSKARAYALKSGQTELKDQKFAGAIFDLGVSSWQLETPQRGFSFLKEGPLDMRMDPNLEVTALDLLKALNYGELNELFTKLGEEKSARKLAAAVVSSRPLINTTTDLANLVNRVVKRQTKIHPATKIFQALRIAVNDELNALKEGLVAVRKLMAKSGVIAVISFHSLEDRIVKNTFREWASLGVGQILTKKPIISTVDEFEINPRSRSAKLRVFRFI